jgi:hypothetical protein
MQAKKLRDRCEIMGGGKNGELADLLGAMRVMVRYRGELLEVWQAMFRGLIEPDDCMTITR